MTTSAPAGSAAGPIRRPQPAVAWAAPPGSATDPRFWQPVDEAYARLLQAERARGSHPWLLSQTLVTNVPRRALYGALNLRPGVRVLDAGTGFAPVAVELAGAFGCRVVGVDNDLDQLDRAASLADALRVAEWLHDSMVAAAGTVSLTAGVVEALPFRNGTFDAVIARFLIQHVTEPATAVAELVRVTRPGGLVCIIDIDDGLCLRYPDPPEPVRRLEEAFQRAQHERGGDRTIGRKIAGMLDDAGVAVDHVLVLPQAAYGAASPAGSGQGLACDRMSACADELVGRGLVDATTVTEGLRMLAHEELPAATVVDMHLGIIGRRRPVA